MRGTVQADILKEDQAQNTCIFSTEFALKMMGDIQQYFVDHEVRNFYSVSISGYHIAEAGANPISPARVHARQRLHDRRVLPRARHGRSTTSRRTCRSSSPTGWTPSTPSSAASRGASGRARCASATAPRHAARCSSTTSRPPADRCTRRRSASTTSAPRCRRCTRCSTTATACTPTPTTRRSPRRPKSRSGARWRSS